MKYFPILFLLFKVGFISAQENHLQDKNIHELSGLVVSSKSDDLLWVHNDSGDKSYVYLIDSKGKTLATYNFNQKVKDCEDISLYKPKVGKHQIFIGDIGDNAAKRDYISIYRFNEPIPNLSQDKNIDIKNVEEIKLTYPDKPKDAECLMVDPIDQKIYIISKREDSVKVYSIPLSVSSQKASVLKLEGTLFFPGIKPVKYVTAGDISSDGSQILIKSYGQIFYWKRVGNETLINSIKKPCKLIDYQPEPQGEAIGFTNDGKKYFTISEGKEASIFLKPIK